jgi:hypothetical protein
MTIYKTLATLPLVALLLAIPAHGRRSGAHHNASQRPGTNLGGRCSR